ncbi:hypothetical protein GCM10018772_22110 [Streptomyces fumanus]|uniref:Uncharacterized protein n=1 Tax=Streptomyces fumanus TaxID=67302 RepID=A0A919ABK0_9ACTN|nr:hypothetical protein GCM10018772_22110 [Streptomyces fumanus]
MGRASAPEQAVPGEGKRVSLRLDHRHIQARLHQVSIRGALPGLRTITASPAAKSTADEVRCREGRLAAERRIRSSRTDIRQHTLQRRIRVCSPSRPVPPRPWW